MREMQLNESEAAKALFRSMGRYAFAVCLIILAVVSIKLGVLRSIALQGSSRIAGGLCGEVDKVNGQAPPIPKLAITPIPQSSTLVNLYPDLEYIPIYPGSEEEM